MEIKARHTKGENLEFVKLETRKYFLCKSITVNQALLLFKVRSRMLDVKINFRNKFQDDQLQCYLCSSGELEEQSHVTQCSAFKQNKFSHFNYNSLTMWPSPIGPPTVVHNWSFRHFQIKIFFEKSCVMVIGITYLKIGVKIY